MRITILCEDRMHEQFLRGLCERKQGYQVVRIRTAPQGEGAASEWVIRQFAKQVRALRALGREQVGLVVALDGDREGLLRRLERLGTELSAEGLVPRNSKNPREKAHRDLLTELVAKDWGRLKRPASQAVLEAWCAGRQTPELPSLVAGRREALRLGLV